VDFAWEYYLRNPITNASFSSKKKFAILEFKRPGAIEWSHWQVARRPAGDVVQGGAKICRQLVKYAWGWNIPFVSVCDFIHLVVMKLKGERRNWSPVAEQHGSATCVSVPAEMQWLSADDMKRGLFIWLKMALKHHLRSQNFTDEQIR